MNIKKITYPDGSFYPEIEMESLRTIFKEPSKYDLQSLTYRINSYNDLWFLKQIKDVLDYNKIQCDLIIPCLLDAQADKRFQDNSSSNLKLICKFVDDMKWNKVYIFHPHNQEVVEAIIDNLAIMNNNAFIANVIKDINSDNLCLLSPDAGAYKWITKLADNLEFKKEVYSASKSRKWEEGKTKLTQSLDIKDFEGKDILIIDDIIIGAGSVIGLSKLLKERNCGKLYVAVSHMTVENPNNELWSSFDKVYTTNSKGLTYIAYNNINENYKPQNLKIINLF